MKFLTLLLGLVSGPHPIELAVEPPVATVELFVDGVPCGSATAPEWVARCDFGPELAPHELVAVGRDGAGKEVARERQWINLPRPPAEAQFLFETKDGKPTARLHWQVVVASDPAVRVTLDGRPVRPDREGRVELPASNPDTIHVLEAELRFSRGITARALATFGGQYGASLESELTAVPFEIDGEAEVEALRGKFRSGEQELAVTAVDRSGADLLVVFQDRFRLAMEEVDDQFALPPGLGKDGYVTYVTPFLHEVTRGASGPAAVLPTSDWQAPIQGGAHWLRRQAVFPNAARRSGLRLADAVAVAGSTAASRGRRRAVLLVLERFEKDESLYAPEAVRAYLERLAVPLVIWDVSSPGARVPPGWGTSRSVRTIGELRRAIRELERTFDRQTVVWFEGGYRPQTIVPAPGATGIRPLR